MMVFVPMPVETARGLRTAALTSPRRGFAATPALKASLGPDTSDDEADFAALSMAGVAALDGLAYGRRLVVAADVKPDHLGGAGDELGEVAVERLSWVQVQALFADEEAAAPRVVAAAAAATGVPLSEALVLPAVTELSEGHDLLWYDPAELDGVC